MTETDESGLSSPDLEDEHRHPPHPPQPHLCSACSQIDFKALFTTHKRRNDWYIRIEETPETCNCFDILEARNEFGWPLPDPANSSRPECSFCAFYTDCLFQSRGIASVKESHRYERPLVLSLRGFHSLIWLWPEHEGCRVEDYEIDRLEYCKHYVQDVFALHFVDSEERQFEESEPPMHVFDSSNFRFKMTHAILRVVDDGPNFGALMRAREAGGGLLARRILPHQVNYGLIDEWLGLCLLEHVQCHSGGDGDVAAIPGFRVIDCATGNIVSLVDVLKSGENQDKAEYITLSYVWGQDGASGPVLGGNSLSLPEELPLVIRDAIEVVKSLGYRYLWIDRYCIPQEDLNAKQIQIHNMDRIYSYSTFTIIAAAGEGPEYGLPGVSTRHRSEQLCVQVAEGISLALYDAPEVLVTASKWHTRGWTYQEGLLSKRRLIFTDQLVYFQCCEMHGDEVLSIPISRATNSDNVNLRHERSEDISYISFEHKESSLLSIFPHRETHWSDPSTIWGKIREFAQKPLAFDADTLDAIAGIFEKYRSCIKGKKILFFCGLPIISMEVRFPFPYCRCLTKPAQNIWACSFPLFFSLPLGQHLCSYVTNGPDSEFDDISDNLTYKLVYSLLWADAWYHPFDPTLRAAIIPTDRKQVRRSEFPSWTWAGWKTCIIDHTLIVKGAWAFDICTQAYVEYENTAGKVQRMHWETENEEILNLTREEGKIPACLVLKGWVFDLKLKLKTDPCEPVGRWSFTWPPCLEHEPIEALPRVLFDDIDNDGSSNPSASSDKFSKDFSFLGLVLAINSINYDRPDFFIPIMILNPVIRTLNGRPQTMYERLHLHSAWAEQRNHEQFWTELAQFARKTEIRLC